MTYDTSLTMASLLTFLLCLIDRIKLGIDVVLKVELGECQYLVYGLLHVNLLGHVRSCNNL